MKGKFKPRPLPREDRRSTEEYAIKLDTRDQRLISGQISPHERKKMRKKVGVWKSTRSSEWKDSIASAFKKGDANDS